MIKNYLLLLFLLVCSTVQAEEPSGLLKILSVSSSWDSDKLPYLYDEGFRVGATEGYNVRLKRYFSNREKGCISSFLILLSTRIIPLHTPESCTPTTKANQVAKAKYRGDLFKETRVSLVEEAVQLFYTPKASQHFFDIGYQYGFLLQVSYDDYGDFLSSCLSWMEGHITHYNLSPEKAYDMQLACRSAAYSYSQERK